MYVEDQLPSHGKQLLDDLPPDEPTVTDDEDQLPKHLANMVLLDCDAMSAKYRT